MAHSVTAWKNVLQQLMPRGKAWPRDVTANLSALLRGFSGRLNRAESSADLLLLEMRPDTTVLLLPEWEEYLALPECNIPNITFDSRRNAVIEKYYRKGGLAPWQIEAVAAALGFTIEVEVILPHHCLRSCTYPLYPARYRFVLKVHVYQIPDGRFTVLDNVLTPLVSDQAMMLECVLNKYRLAGTGYEFIYEGDF
ncbi:TPA: YmfQ family protein [Yersinia enterocolitica]